MKPPPGTVSRYTAGARVNHWLTAACLIAVSLMPFVRGRRR